MILHWKFQLLLIGIHAVRKVQLEAMAEHHYQFHNFKLLTTTPPQAMEYVFFFFDLGEFAVVFAENSLASAVQGLHREKTANCCRFQVMEPFVKHPGFQFQGTLPHLGSPFWGSFSDKSR